MNKLIILLLNYTMIISIAVSETSCSKNNNLDASASKKILSSLLVFPKVPEPFFIIEELRPKKYVLRDNSIKGSNVLAVTRHETNNSEGASLDTAFAYFRWNPNLTLSYSNNNKCLYQFDTLLISETIVTTSGDIFENKYTYTSLGYSLKWKDDILTYTGDKITSTLKYGELYYDNSNRITSSSRGWNFSYNENGFIKQKSLIINNVVQSLTSYTYNADNKIASQTYENSLGEKTRINTERYSYNTNGDIAFVETIEKDANNNIVFNKKTTLTYTYNAPNGNWNERKEDVTINDKPTYSFATISIYYLR